MQIQGVIPANILPLTAELEIDEAAYRGHLEWLVSVTGIGGITCNGHAGEVASLTRAERRRAVEIAVDQVRHRVPVIAGIYAESYREAVVLAEDAVAAGADALLVFPLPALVYGTAPDVPYRHFAEIADAVSLPLVAFSFPAWTRMAYAEDLLVKICSIPAVSAVKDWTLDIGVYERNYRAVKAVRPDIAVLSSFSTNLLPSLAVGADGILSGHGSVICDLQVEIFQAAKAGDFTAARRVYDRIQILTDTVYRAPMGQMYTRMKEQLVMLGRLENPAVRPPLERLGQAEVDQLRASLVAAELLQPQPV